MKNYELLESIGFVDEELLHECETAKQTRRPIAFKVLLVAAIIAMLSITAVAANRLFADVYGGEIVPHSFTVKTLDANWNVTYEQACAGYILTAKIDTFTDVPMKLLYPYLPAIPEDWECSGAANAKYNDEIGMVGISWTYTEADQEYEVFYRQESAYIYNTCDDRVWWITDIPDDVTMTGESATIGEASVYLVKVSESKHAWSHPSFAHNMIFWSDGYSIFQLRVPQYWSEDRVYALMCSLTLQDNIEIALNNLE